MFETNITDMKRLEEFPNRKQIVVIGGGFAGLSFAKRLLRNRFYEVTLIDKNNFNYFTPLLYQVATGFLEPSNISYPFRKIFRNSKVNFRIGEVTAVDTQRKVVHLGDDQISYDHLIFAAGAKANFFNNQSVLANAISLKGMEDALFMRNELMRTMEKATTEKDPKERLKLLTIVVAGGGPTGVEVAGMLAEMKKFIIKKDYPELAQANGRIYIVDGNSVLLAPMSEKTHQEAYDALYSLGVRIKLNTHVKSYENGIVTFSDGKVIEAGTLIWCAGVTAHIFNGIPQSSLGIGNRMHTDAFSKVIGLEDVYAIGDIAVQYTDSDYLKGHPQLAQPAIQQGKALARNLLRMAKGKKLIPFKYFDRGDMAIIGRNQAVADLFKHKFHLSGFLGLFSWLFIHLISLVNYNNKLKTLYSWIVAYLTKDQALRMIFFSKEKH